MLSFARTAGKAGFFCLLVILLTACSSQRRVVKSVRRQVIDAPALQGAHIGIAIYDPAIGKFLYDYQGDHFFVPASNTKLATCYAALKFLGDSIVGLRYGIPEEDGAKENAVVLDATGDPTLMHPDFQRQPVLDFLQSLSTRGKKPGFLHKENSIERWGNGWSWNDYESSYMAERSALPVFGNVADVSLADSTHVTVSNTSPLPRHQLFRTPATYLDSVVNHDWQAVRDKVTGDTKPRVRLRRAIGDNQFTIEPAADSFTRQRIPFTTSGLWPALDILQNRLNTTFSRVKQIAGTNEYDWTLPDGGFTRLHINRWMPVYSQSRDSLLALMMHRSDNFFAEQCLLMISNERWNRMDDGKIIDTLLAGPLSGLPQPPRWADGSGLSRYNLFTPRDFVEILDRMRREFGMERMKKILPTGGEGTLSSYYKTEEGNLFAKTGTLSGVVALSGFLYTKQGRLLEFSILVNNHTGSATDVRRAVERFVRQIRADW